MSKNKKLKKISKELKKASRLHAGQAKKIDSMLRFDFGSKGSFDINSKKSKNKRDYTAKEEMDYSEHNISTRRTEGTIKQQKELREKRGALMKAKTSPALLKLSASCKAAARRKFKVYPSAYANMWAAKTQRQGKC